ncbi:hypothetical protein RQP53_21415 [Paucibacter sp. APW11]|uniref:Uncharacterized protein n=1 Tax=Roseateles aquae TaxID=3077235 RepID=A0ABU3PHF9_9BURK|nr:hypothetical protein [Paucibacter sp. APW11]MDT9001850.1 hypothetical protein [Paucibacter sp. APW11]
MTAPALTRHHRARLMQVWRSAGWPCKDGIEIDLLAAGLLQLQQGSDGRETLRLSEAGIALLAEARQRGVRAASGHDRLAQKFAERLIDSGRIVWRELSLRAQLEAEAAPPLPLCGSDGSAQDLTPALQAAEAPPPSLFGEALPDSAVAVAARKVWRMARPDLFSLRNTSVPAYLQPIVHEIKFSRADLLSDLRHAAKRAAYQWLCSEVYYVFPAGVAKPNEIPLEFGVWVLHGDVGDGQFELLRPARHQPCTLPFAVWLALAKAAPLRREEALDENEPAGQLPLQDRVDAVAAAVAVAAVAAPDGAG